MKDYQKEFLHFVIENSILRFGEFHLKSGRVSPYFFNAGLFSTGSKLGFLAQSYAAAIADLTQDYDVLFGPAYKGIPLAAATALSLSTRHGIDKPYCFNRKEAKDHGEGGFIVGAPLTGRVLVVDDVITAGTAIREAVEIIQSAGAQLASIAVAMDRQERGLGETSAIQEIEQTYGIEVTHIISLQNIIDFLQDAEDEVLAEHLPAVERYRSEYGA
ncbi:MAG: orotate phosphoribosyltransferase [Pseudomonadota bacterium]|nr:orotate phosphoribosyltransferase [Pseudomonadota bacterium]MEC7549449.1 orotate phosphoribosyltransferase [Pseudomonadota bacterium]MEC7582064.1 orotate phosphoribosyltransferase [Pseudomonadota bacterium]MEC7997201.1 orotate phosphoribosyltransferase [Pseudomonadota bacterium]MEC8331457.1 orotate phosphoribosyltransferase [Pseudomonadota bacterium]